MIDYNSGWTDAAVRRLIRRVGQEQIMDLICFRRTDILAHGLHNQQIRPLLELEKRVERLMKGPMVTTPPDLAIDGCKVMEILNIAPGPEVGNILKQLVEKVTDNPELNTETELVATLEYMKAD